MPVSGAMNMLAWQMNESAEAPQRTLQFAAFGFDVSFQEIFSTLCAGGTLVLIDEEKRRNATDMARYVMEKGIQRLFLPVVGLQMLAEGVAESGEPFDCALREINVAGEQLRINDKIRALFQAPGALPAEQPLRPDGNSRCKCIPSGYGKRPLARVAANRATDLECANLHIG